MQEEPPASPYLKRLRTLLKDLREEYAKNREAIEAGTATVSVKNLEKLKAIVNSDNHLFEQEMINNKENYSLFIAILSSAP